MGDAACSKVRPHAFVERPPIAPMNIEDHAAGRAFRQEQIKALAPPAAIGKVELGARSVQHSLTKVARRLDPGCRPTLGAGDVGAVGISVVPIGDAVADHSVFPRQRRSLAKGQRLHEGVRCFNPELSCLKHSWNDVIVRALRKDGADMRVAVLGGGPAGLYFAIAMKLRDPGHQVAVFERNRPDDTFGWGVVLSDETLANLAANDPV